MLKLVECSDFKCSIPYISKLKLTVGMVQLAL